MTNRCASKWNAAALASACTLLLLPGIFIYGRSACQAETRAQLRSVSKAPQGLHLHSRPWIAKEDASRGMRRHGTCCSSTRWHLARADSCSEPCLTRTNRCFAQFAHRTARLSSSCHALPSRHPLTSLCNSRITQPLRQVQAHAVFNFPCPRFCVATRAQEQRWGPRRTLGLHRRVSRHRRRPSSAAPMLQSWIRLARARPLQLRLRLRFMLLRMTYPSNSLRSPSQSATHTKL